VAHRSAQDRRAGVFGGRTLGGQYQHALRAARLRTRGCGRQSQLPSTAAFDI